MDTTAYTFYDSGQTLINEMTSSNTTDPGIRAEFSAIRSRLETLRTDLERTREHGEQVQYNYDHFLMGLGEMNIKLCALETMLRDDLCQTHSGRVTEEERAKWKVCLWVSRLCEVVVCTVLIMWCG